jgi:ADP-heptose:LPS heptosyltransferase
MSVSKKLTVFRKKLMRGLTKNVGRSRSNLIRLPHKAEIKRVLICRPNHRLGNLLLISPLIEEITNTFPDCKIDIFVKGGLAPSLFKNFKNVDHIIQLPRKPGKQLLSYLSRWIAIKRHRYDVAINVINYSSSGKLSTQFSNATDRIFGDEDEEVISKYDDYKHVAKYPVYCFRNYLTKLGYPDNTSPVTTLTLKLSTEEVTKGKKLLDGLIDDTKKTIAIFTYATGAKCYLPLWWKPFYEKLKTEYAGYNIVEILPAENVSQIDFKAPAFYSKDIREIGAVIANCIIFIGADSGIMHLASAVQTPVVGLFSITKPETFKPYGNNSVAIDTNTTTTIHGILKIINKILALVITYVSEPLWSAILE